MAKLTTSERREEVAFPTHLKLVSPEGEGELICRDRCARGV